MKSSLLTMMVYSHPSYDTQSRSLKHVFYGASISIFAFVILNTIVVSFFSIADLWMVVLFYSINAFLLFVIYSLITYSAVLASRIYLNAKSYFKVTTATFMLSMFFLFLTVVFQIVNYIYLLSGEPMSFIFTLLSNVFGNCSTVFLIIGFIFLFLALQRTPLTKFNIYLLIHIFLISAKAIVIIVTQMNMEKSDTYAKALFASYIFTVVYFTFLAILFIIKGNEVSQSLYFTSFPLSTQPTTSSSRKPYTTGKKFCTNCGAEVDPKEPYCNSCGAKLI